MEQLSSWVQGNADLLVMTCVAALFVSSVVYLFHAYSPSKITGEGNMNTRAEWEHQDRSRRLQERQQVIDMFEDGLLKLLTNGKISDVGYKNWRARFAVVLNQEEMFPEIIDDLNRFKDILKKRRNGGTYYGVYKVVKIPGPKPGEQEVHAKNDIHRIFLNL